MSVLKKWANHYTRILMWILAMYTLLKLFSLFVVEKCDFLLVVKIPHPKIQFLVSLMSSFSTYKLFPERGAGMVAPVIKFKKRFFNDTMSSLAGLKKSYLIFRKSTDFGHFWLPRSTFKVDFLNV